MAVHFKFPHDMVPECMFSCVDIATHLPLPSFVESAMSEKKSKTQWMGAERSMVNGIPYSYDSLDVTPAQREAEKSMVNGMPPGYIPLDVAPKCTWGLGKPPSESPHQHKPKK